MKLFCFGLGQTVKNLISELKKKNFHNISLISRSHCKDVENYYKINEGYIDKEIIKKVIESTHILISLPPPYENFVLKNFKNIINESKNLKWLGYLSSTSVYGNHDGKWVDENSITKPQTTLGKKRLSAEKNLLKLKKLRIFRLSGIYSKKNNVFNRINNNQIRVIKGKDNYFSRIYIDDIIETLIKSFENLKDNQIYNVCDDLPTKYVDVIKYACQLLNKDYNFPEIEFNQIENKILSEFYKDNKRVSNKKIKESLGVNLKFPTYKHGLDYIFKNI
ncbi:MAG: hypothetical protein CMI81_01580 [Candidatus Pelagibacter sp.]|nr:hypothetical protein [Candidatus Pelagibacter sp.]OUV97994.1 MAG: hypothetical protein CBD02_02195 [Candidatus Pelagibacter sp. TMED142]